MFLNSSIGDLHPAPGSPVIDLGNSAAIVPDNTDVNDNSTIESQIPWDLDKLTRVVYIPCRVDMGAFEDQCECIGDNDGDRAVDLQDLANLLACFGLSVSCSDIACYRADQDCDGAISLADLTLLLSNFGNICCVSFAAGGSGGENLMAGGGNSEMPSPEFVDWARQATIEELFAWRDEYVGSNP